MLGERGGGFGGEVKGEGAEVGPRENVGLEAMSMI